MITLAILLTVHNRKSKTLSCLERVFSQDGLVNTIFDVYVTNDGSTDGTKEAIEEKFPQVNLIHGDGSLFWNRGMHKAWEKAVSIKDYDFYLWLNDDTILFPHSLNSVLLAYKSLDKPSLICGSTINPDLQFITYGGRNKKGQLIVPNGQFQECQTVNGNFVLVPKEIFNSVGNLDWFFHHAMGDIDYSLRAQKEGFSCYVGPSYIGICESKSGIPICFNKENSILVRFKFLYSPLSYCDPIQYFIFEKRHFGITKAVFHFFTIHLRVLFPSISLLKKSNKRDSRS